MTNSTLVTRTANYLRGLTKLRNSAVVTADDAQSFLNRQPAAFGLTANERRSIINSVLRRPNFRAVGRTQSTREVARGRTITEWTIN